MGRKCTLTEEQEEELSDILQDMERKLYGLTTEAVRKIVFEFCVKNNIPHNFCEEKQCAGRKWMRLFLRRHPELSIRKPESTSIQRALGYNRAKIKVFEDVLKKELFTNDGSRKIPPENIFNVDETGVTVNHKPQKIVAARGKKSVAVINSAEKGKTVTAVCCVSAAGHYCPPLLIFPRVRMKAELLDKAPVGAIGVANKSGWINEKIFVQWFDHFLGYFQPQHRSSPSLLIMDGHTSHVSLELVNKARDNNVSLLILPSHCTHKVQPLDVAVFKSFKSQYDRAVMNWLHAHPGRAVQESNVAELFSESWGKAATVANAISGFAKSRINPYVETDTDDEDYAAADVTDMPLEALDAGVEITGQPKAPVEVESPTMPSLESASLESAGEVIKQPLLMQPPEESSTAEVLIEPSSSLQLEMVVETVDQVPLASSLDAGVEGTGQPKAPVEDESPLPTMPSLESASLESAGEVIKQPLLVQSPEESSTASTFRHFIPVPKCQRTKRSTRAVAHAKVITASPYKLKLEEAAAEKTRKEEKQKKRASGVSHPRKRTGKHNFYYSINLSTSMIKMTVLVAFHGFCRSTKQ